MINQDYILLIINCEKYSYKSEYQKKTWLKDIPKDLIYFHIIGNQNLEKDYYFNYSDNILYVKTKDDYNSLPHKIIMSYKAIYETYKFKYIFKTDDDQMLTNAIFLNTYRNIINTSKTKIHYGGSIVDVKIPYLSKYYLIHPGLPLNLIIQKTKYCNGRFYFLSKEAIKYLLSKFDKIKEEYLEDYAIGLYLSEEYKKNMLNIDSQKYFKDITDYKLDENIQNENSYYTDRKEK